MRDLFVSELCARASNQLWADRWETSYHYAPLGPVSGDYCDLYPSDGRLFFMLGDVSGKGVAASMRMTQLHALFRSLIGMGFPLAEIVERINGFLCESGLSGQYATLVCGRAEPGGEVELFNAGHLPVIAVQQGGLRLVESTGFPLGMFRGGESGGPAEFGVRGGSGVEVSRGPARVHGRKPGDG